MMADLGSPRKALLLLNVGSPEGQWPGPSPEQVKVYLREFLMDPYVVDLPFLFRWFLVTQIILRTRPRKSAEAYHAIWTREGSPLLVHTEALKNALAAELGEGWVVRAAMRYGRPSIRSVLEELAVEPGLEEIVVFPLYPQYAAATTETSLLEFRKWNASLLPGIPSRVIGAFYERPEFLEPAAKILTERATRFQPDHVLFSFHGLPERHIRRASREGHCLGSADCCGLVSTANESCYRAQCFATARQLAARAGLAPERFTVSFQSRLGVTRWIQPYTWEIYGALARQGVRRLLVACPSFVADCLETLEEIGMRGREEFLRNGGEAFELVPAVNSDPAWVAGAANMVREHL